MAGEPAKAINTWSYDNNGLKNPKDLLKVPGMTKELFDKFPVKMNPKFNHPNKNIADKYDFWERRLKQGREPACVVTCLTSVRIFENRNDPSSEITPVLKRGKLVRVVNAKVDTKPSIYYFNNTFPYPGRSNPNYNKCPR